MKVLLRYLSNYKGLVALALLFAALNQMFSLLDQFIYGKLIYRYATHPTDYD